MVVSFYIVRRLGREKNQNYFVGQVKVRCKKVSSKEVKKDGKRSSKFSRIEVSEL